MQRQTTSWVSLSALIVLGCAGATPPPAEPAPVEAASEPSSPEPSRAAPPDALEDDEEDAWEGEEAALEDDAGKPKNLSDGETRTMQVIQDTVKANRARVRACYDTVQAKIPTLKGDLTIRFVLSSLGAVKKAELNEERSTLKNPELVACAIEAIKNIRFPESSKGLETQVDYPFNFNPR